MGRFSFLIWVYFFDIFQRFYDYKGPRQYFFHAFIDGFCFMVSGVLGDLWYLLGLYMRCSQRGIFCSLWTCRNFEILKGVGECELLVASLELWVSALWCPQFWVILFLINRCPGQFMRTSINLGDHNPPSTSRGGWSRSKNAPYGVAPKEVLNLRAWEGANPLGLFGWFWLWNRSRDSWLKGYYTYF